MAALLSLVFGLAALDNGLANLEFAFLKFLCNLDAVRINGEDLLAHWHRGCRGRVIKRPIGSLLCIIFIRG